MAFLLVLLISLTSLFFLLLIPSARRFWELTVFEDNKKYLLKCLLDLLLAFIFSYLILAGLTFTLRESIVSSKLIDNPFWRCLLIYYCCLLVFVLSVYFLKRSKFNLLFIRYLISSMFAVIFIIINSAVIYIFLPMIHHFKFAREGKIMFISYIILFSLSWSFFALPAIKNFNKGILAKLPAEKVKAAIIHYRTAVYILVSAVFFALVTVFSYVY